MKTNSNSNPIHQNRDFLLGIFVKTDIQYIKLNVCVWMNAHNTGMYIYIDSESMSLKVKKVSPCIAYFKSYWTIND